MNFRISLFSLGLLLTAVGGMWLLPNQALAAIGGCDKLQTQFNSYGGRFGNFTNTLPQYCTPTGLLQFIINTILSLVGGVTVVLIMVGGFRYITSGGNQEMAAKGKQTVLYSAIGLAVVMMAAAAVNIIINLVVNGKAF